MPENEGVPHLLKTIEALRLMNIQLINAHKDCLPAWVVSWPLQEALELAEELLAFYVAENGYSARSKQLVKRFEELANRPADLDW